MGKYYEALLRWNCSSIFLLPLLKIPMNVLGEMGLINTFLDDLNKENYDIQGDLLYLLFNNTDSIVFSDFLSEYKDKIEIIDDYDYEGGWIVVVVRLDEKWKEDYSKFYEGKYSEMSKEFKEQFPYSANTEDDKGVLSKDTTLQWSIFKKDKRIALEWNEEYGLDVKRNNEVWQCPQMDKEVLTEEYLENLIKKVKND